MLASRIIASLLIAAAAAVGVAAMLPDGPPEVAARLAPLPLTATALPLDNEDPGRLAAGALRFLGAVQLRSTHPGFGGISGLRWHDTPQGGWLLGVTDTGNWVMFRPAERAGRLIGVSEARWAPILMADGKPASTKADGDAEALEWPAHGDLTAGVFFEQDHRLAVFPGIDPDRPASFARAPAQVIHDTRAIAWPSNGGGEALVALPGGRVLVFSEQGRGADGAHDVLLIGDDHAEQGSIRLGYRPPEGFSPTDAVRLDDGRVLVLNRRYDGTVAARLTLVDVAPMLAARAAGRSLADTGLPSREIAALAPPQTVDNMEGLALRCEAGAVMLYLVSDDNLSSLQRTLLMKFALDPAVSASACVPPPSAR